MKMKHSLEAADVKTILAGAEAAALARGWAVTIAVVDDGGHLLGLTRLDGAPASSAHLAPGKAVTAIMGRRESKAYEEMIFNGRVAMLSASGLSAMLEGGIPIVIGGDFIGAVGVSGVKPDEDALVAAEGINSLSSFVA
jgi:glc operon protein GlcG